MPSSFQDWADRIRRLHCALTALEPGAASVGGERPAGQQWFELLEKKLLAQLDAPPILVVGVVGGTNIGKSVLFNHLAGQVTSGVSPLAAGTKHPVCLAPPELADPELLARMFGKFRLCAWQSADDPLGESAEHRLFWRSGQKVPPKLLLLDAPDVDSDAKVNWERARAVRQSADVLIAVLTQQKYNDAAVKQFFREAVAAEKPIVVVFNQCNLQDDRPYWPQWLDTFCAETDARPELVYVVPHDRQAAEELRLPFYEVGRDGRRPPGEPSSLREELGALHFDTVKIRTFRGAIGRVLDAEHGAGAYLDAIRRGSEKFAAAAGTLSATEMARVAWPPLPPSVVVDEIRRWWDAGRTEWSRRVHGVYRKLGQGVTWPIRTAWANLSGGQSDPLALLHRKEREAIVTAVAKMLDELDRLAELGNETLRPRLLKLLAGNAREQLLEDVRTAHEELPAVDDDYRQFLQTELDSWKASSPRAVSFLRSLDHAAAIARPAITISLAVSGWVVAGDLVGQAAVQAAGHTASELATEAAIAGGIAGGGEAIVSTTSEGVRQAAGRLFGRLQARYAQGRARWLANWLEDRLLGDLLGELRRSAEVPQSDPFIKVQTALEELRDATG